MTTKKQIAAEVAYLTACFPAWKANETTIAAFHQELSDLDAHDLHEAVRGYVRDDRSGFAPSVGQLRARAAGAQRAIEAAEDRQEDRFSARAEERGIARDWVWGAYRRIPDQLDIEIFCDLRRQMGGGVPTREDFERRQRIVLDMMPPHRRAEVLGERQAHPPEAPDAGWGRWLARASRQEARNGASLAFGGQEVSEVAQAQKSSTCDPVSSDEVWL